jgi:hypothetical protein
VAHVRVWHKFIENGQRVERRVEGTQSILLRGTTLNVYHGGDGQFAFVTPCREVHYSLWPSKEEADKRKAKVDKTACCGGCRPWTHYVVDLGGK